MAQRNGVISKPVSIEDVYSAMGKPANNNLSLEVICKNTLDVNGWSLHRAIPHGGLNPLVENDFYNSYSYPDPIQTIVGSYGNVNKKWTLSEDKVPSGGSAEPFRLSDWDEYNHNAIPAIVLEKNQIEFEEANSVTVEASFKIDSSNKKNSYGSKVNNIVIPVNKLFNETSNSANKMTWGIARNVGANSWNIAYADMNMDSSYNIVPGAVPNQVNLRNWSKISNDLNSLSPGGSITYFPFIAVTSYESISSNDNLVNNGNGNVINGRMYCFPLGETIIFTKKQSSTTPDVDDVSIELDTQSNIFIYYLDAPLGCWYPNNSGNWFLTGVPTIGGPISTTSNVYVLLKFKNNSSKPVTINASSFVFNPTEFKFDNNNTLEKAGCVGIANAISNGQGNETPENIYTYELNFLLTGGATEYRWIKFEYNTESLRTCFSNNTREVISGPITIEDKSFNNTITGSYNMKFGSDI